jgi:serine phosphatase RsbU (regulator of sigma subunit)
MGLFAIGYAASAVILRNRFWKAMLPLMAVQFIAMGFVAHWYPNARPPAQLNEKETAQLHTRIAFDGMAVIVLVCLGYVGFVHVSITEARRYAKTQADKAALEGEMAAAHEVQRVMVPQTLPTVIGYTIETVYSPAAEVGGDFFQVLQLKSGRTLLVIGDVSGKGLSAAMIVSTIVGMLWVVSEFTEDPAEILLELNRRLCGRTQGGFATCLLVRIEQEGRLTFSNAGHPAPYLNGNEISVEGSMPLGLVEGADYSTLSIEMHTGDRAVLLTDGIPEARNERGELFGFSRVEATLREYVSIRMLAEMAEKHGQDDDLTLISIKREG